MKETGPIRIPASEIILPSDIAPDEIHIRLTGIPTGERIKKRDNYYFERNELEKIIQASCVANEINSDDFVRLLYYPQCWQKTVEIGTETRVIEATLATTLMAETRNKSTGIKKWRTIGHIWGVNDSDLEGLGFQKWKESDYILPKIELPLLRRNDTKMREELDLWIAENNALISASKQNK